MGNVKCGRVYSIIHSYEVLEYFLFTFAFFCTFLPLDITVNFIVYRLVYIGVRDEVSKHYKLNVGLLIPDYEYFGRIRTVS